jgi:hypothetical protein
MSDELTERGLMAKEEEKAAKAASSNSENNIADKVRKVNALLLKGEPNNITVDSYSNYTGYSPQYIIDAMNAVMFGEWGFEEMSNQLVDKDDSGKPGLAIAQVSVWLSGVEFRPKAYGQSRVTRGDFGDAQKGAQTDAIKKALSYFSIGNRAYHGKLEKKKA